jgi:formate/nitrite transporter FocA (FNT family)
VLVTNLVGATLFAVAMARTRAFEPAIRSTALAMGEESLQNGFGTVLLRGVYAGWLIALMVWLLPVAETARVWVIIIITYLVGLMGLSHIIAGSVEVLAVAAAGNASWGRCIGGYIVPALTGNVIGGVSLVAALNHAQVVAGAGQERG